jgi:hypothetical protein
MTEPIKEILPKESSHELEQILNSFSRLIDEFVNFGTHILMWIIQESKGSDEQMPLTMFFRDMLEKADSISTLIRNSNVEPSKVILRSIFELNLYIKYLLEENFYDRSMSFLVWNTKRKIRIYRAFDKDDQSYSITKKQLENDEFFSDLSFLSEIPSVKSALINQEKILKLPDYQAFVKEYERTRKKDNNNPNWYRLFNGPKNIIELASKMKLPFLYEILYRKWSESVHGTDIIKDKIVRSKNSNAKKGKVNADIVQLRLPKDAQEVTSYTLILMLMIFIKLRDKKIKIRDKEIKEWYLSIRDAYIEILGKKRFIKINY